jgi:site-specific DNA-methyltransferase (adenine-specific)
MFSFDGDNVLDPFVGTGTTMLAALQCHRNSTGIEVDEKYCRMALRRLQSDGADLFSSSRLEFIESCYVSQESRAAYEKAGSYQIRKTNAPKNRRISPSARGSRKTRRFGGT